MDLGVCEAAQWCCCSGGDVSPSWSSRIFFCEGRKTVDKRAWRGKRGWSGGEEQSSGQGPWEKRQGPEGAREKRRGGVDPTISPSPEFPGSARLDFLGGGASYRALLIVAQTLITQPPWRISSLFDDNDTTLGSWNCAATKSPCYRATISTAPHKSRNLPRSTFLMAHVLI